MDYTGYEAETVRVNDARKWGGANGEGESQDEADDRHDREEKPSKLWILVGLGALALGVLVYFGLQWLGGRGGEQAQTQDTVPAVETVIAEAEGRGYRVTEEGFLRPRARVEVVAEQAGKVESVAENLVPGGRFEEGEVLLRLDDREARAQLQQARADLQSARASLEQVRADAGRQERLAEIGAAPVARAEQARADLAGAEARVEQARAQVEIAEERLEDTVLRAPFSATVQSEDVAVGTYVAPGEVLATIYDDTSAEVALGMSPADAAAVRRAQVAAGEPLEVAVSPTAASATSVTLIGRVTQIATALDPQARTVTVTVEVDDAFDPDKAGLVYADDFVEVTLPALGVFDLYATPSGVLRKEAYVWRVTDEDTLEKVEVTPLKQDEDRLVFSTEADLAGVPLLLTALTEEAAGMKVEVQDRSQDRASLDDETNVGQDGGDAAP
jgi:RND family efflux transporter MFP subunit